MKLYETITAENWVKGVMGNGERGCLHGHLAAVYGDGDPWLRAGWKLSDTIRLLYPERTRYGLISFNDHPDTTLEDILRVCKVADV